LQKLKELALKKI